MKRTILLLVLSFVVTNCTDKKSDVLDQKVTTYIKANATDPDSYQPVSTEILDTVYVNKFAAGLMGINTDEIKMIEKDLENLNRILSELDPKKDEKKIQALRQKIEEGKQAIETIKTTNKKIEPLLENKEIAFIKVVHSCKLNNAKGELVDDHIYMLLDDQMNVLMAKEKGRKNTYQTIDFFKEKYLR